MTLLECHEFVKTVCSYYERKTPNDYTLDLWFDRCKNVPYEPLAWIHRKIFEQYEAFPKNLPLVIWQLYQAWLDSHPEKKAPAEMFYCPDCEAGWLVLEKDQDPYRVPISATAPCGRCRQLKMANHMRLDEALLKGYRRKNLVTEHTVKRRNIRDLVAGIGRDVPQPQAVA